MNEFGDFTISINGTGSFGNKNQILWLGVDKGQDQLQRINYELQIQLENYLDNQIKSKFAPHLTIGRKKKTEISNNIDVKNFMNSVYFPIEFHINFFTLFESRIINDKVHYKRINKFNLT
jgi:2'-5' RNA ligase